MIVRFLMITVSHRVDRVVCISSKYFDVCDFTVFWQKSHYEGLLFHNSSFFGGDISIVFCMIDWCLNVCCTLDLRVLFIYMLFRLTNICIKFHWTAEIHVLFLVVCSFIVHDAASVHLVNTSSAGVHLIVSRTCGSSLWPRNCPRLLFLAFSRFLF